MDKWRFRADNLQFRFLHNLRLLHCSTLRVSPESGGNEVFGYEFKPLEHFTTFLIFPPSIGGIWFESSITHSRERRVYDGGKVLPLGQPEFDLLEFGRAESLFRRELFGQSRM